MPRQWEGTSGSPVFKVIVQKKKKWVEFAGVQSGKNDYFDCGYIVKQEEVSKVISNRGN